MHVYVHGAKAMIVAGRSDRDKAELLAVTIANAGLVPAQWDDPTVADGTMGAGF